QGEALKILLSRNIKLFRVHSGLSQEELAEKAGISVPYLATIERGGKWPSPATLSKIAYALNLEPYDLLKPENVSSIEVRKIVSKLAKDISVLVNESVKMLNNVSKDGGSK
ncbi:MAG: helix-turn-helix domain-containing protein, partial [Treponema sp.]|nr:helix-turn-helix domain-containing protein [Treponema sp.]